VLLGIVFSHFSCESPNTYVKSEINEVYSVQGSSDEFRAGNLLYRDSIVFQHENLPKAKYIFDKAQLTILGQEVYPDVTTESQVRSDYSDSEGNPLSYYKLSLNSDKRKARSEAYDASNDELLRIEEMDYNAKGELSSRRIFTSAGQLASSYSFVYDAFGNEIIKVTQHLLRDTTITEESRITKYDESKKWTEKWGFINDKPVAYYKRKVITH